MNVMIRKIQKIYQRLEQYENRDDDDDYENDFESGSSSNNDKDVNPSQTKQ